MTKTLAEIYYNGSYGDKGSVHSYIELYEHLLAPYRAKGNATILEIGLFRGESLRLWEEYFGPEAWVHGIDACDQPLGGMADLRPMIAEGTHNIHLLDATDKAKVNARFDGIDFDVIVEDASHGLQQQLDIYAAFRDKLKPGGLYVIEDVEDIDKSRQTLLDIDHDRLVKIHDLRRLKNRFDDVLVIIRA